jgi:hypothetical protein
MRAFEIEPKSREVELEIENGRLQKLVAELIARNQQLRSELDYAIDCAIARK